MKNIPLFGDFTETKVLIEAKEGKPKKIYLEGVNLQGDINNGNNRMYPLEVLSEAINIHCNRFLDAGRCVGELGHPKVDLHKIDYNNVAIKFIKVEQNGSNFITKSLVLEEGKGKILTNLIENEIQVGISSRGFGPTKLVEGIDIIQKLHLISLGDIEHNPSAPDALLTAICENKEWIFENGIIVEKDLSEKIETYQDALSKAPKSQIKSVMKEVFTDYFNQLK